MNTLQQFMKTRQERHNSKKIMKWLTYNQDNYHLCFYGTENSFQVSDFDSRLEIKKEKEYFFVKVVYVHEGYVFGGVSISESKLIKIAAGDLLYANIKNLYDLHQNFLKEENFIRKEINDILKKGVNMDRLRWKKKSLDSSIRSRIEGDNYERNVLGKTPTFPYDPSEDKEELSKITAILDEYDNLYREMYLLEKKYNEQIKETLSLACKK